MKISSFDAVKKGKNIYFKKYLKGKINWEGWEQRLLEKQKIYHRCLDFKNILNLFKDFVNSKIVLLLVNGSFRERERERFGKKKGNFENQIHMFYQRFDIMRMQMILLPEMNTFEYILILQNIKY